MADPLDLSRRERQILEVIFRNGRATAQDVLAQLPDPPTYTSVRGLLRVLETKGHVRHEEEDGRYVYFPTMTRQRAAKSVLRNVVSTFFDNSPSAAMAALLGGQKSLSEEELDRLQELVTKARKKS
ncbi:MAG: CopY family transcriptional regulator [Acidobacteria bacterium]|nr:MAG: CopY family transcriptional regulator [Acidobacteriota bacterium]